LSDNLITNRNALKTLAKLIKKAKSLEVLSIREMGEYGGNQAIVDSLRISPSLKNLKHLYVNISIREDVE